MFGCCHTNRSVWDTFTKTAQDMESSLVGKLLEKDLLPQSQIKLFGPEKQGASASLSLGPDEVDLILFEWTTGINVEDRDASEKLHRQLRRFREVVRWCLNRRSVRVVVLTRAAPQFAGGISAKPGQPGPGMYTAMCKCLVNEDVPGRVGSFPN